MPGIRGQAIDGIICKFRVYAYTFSEEIIIKIGIVFFRL